MAAATKTALMMMLLLLTTVVATHAHTVSCKNECPVAITVNGQVIGSGKSLDINIDVNLELELLDKYGKTRKGSCKVPADVRALVFLSVGGLIKVKVTAVLSVLGGILHTLLGTILLVVQVIL